jgi:hypothetical protein
MKYLDSITDFFKSPKWVMNLLLGGVCALIPILGIIVLMGWLVTGFWARREEGYATFPDFDFGQFSKYLERGLWLFLVSLVVGLAIWIPLGILFGILGVMASLVGGDGGGVIAMLLGLVSFVIYVGAMLLVLCVLKPTMIRAALTQDFAKSFDFAFIKKFISLTWLESIVSSIFLAVASTVLITAGMVAFCIGSIFASVLVYFAWMHLDKQLYNLYLSRGGEPVVPSPKLTDTAPALPS